MEAETVTFVDEASVRATVARVFGDLHSALRQLLPTADVEHVGSTSMPGSLTKGDLDVCVLVERSAFHGADRVLAAHFARNVGSHHSDTLSSFVDDARAVPVGVQLVARGGEEDFFVRWRDLLNRTPRLLAEYNALKRRWHGRAHDDYRAAKAKFIEDALRTG